MKIKFHKYQGAGNDFILIDNRKGEINLNSEQIKHLCNRHFGIGSDGLILLENSDKEDFAMRFFNPDGSSGMMCGNGGRCIVSFAKLLGLFEKKCSFEAPDGVHHGEIEGDMVRLQMSDTAMPTFFEDGMHLDTGTSHFVVFTDNLEGVDICSEGRKLRFDQRFDKFGGCNVNFVKPEGKNQIAIRTYERGVEDETLACGTGITASALATSIKQKFEDGFHTIKVSAKGGELSVEFNKSKDKFSNIVLCGKGEKIFCGETAL